MVCSTMPKHTRREFTRLAAASTATAAGVLTFGSAATGQSTDHNWEIVESPTNKSLNDAVDTIEGPFAAGADGNVVARRNSGWQTVVEYGPQARDRRLTGIAATDDGKAVWFVGGSGVIGEYNIETRTLTNYSAPMGKTSTWEDCAVRGNSGENERLYFVNGSGELLVGDRQDSGAVEYNDVMEPGGGSTIPAIGFSTREEGHVCSTSQFVAETFDGGDTWEQIGIDFSGVGFFDIASQDERDVNVAAGNGIIYRYDGFRWTPHVVDDERQDIRALDRDGSEGLAAGNNGKIYERQSAGQWRKYVTSTEERLDGVARGETYDIAVGAGGTIVERQNDGNSDSGNSNNNSNSNGNSTDSMTAGTETVSTESLSDESLSVEEYVEGEWVA